jgi:hypothetical protein
VDESTDIQNKSILLTYVQYNDHDENDMKEEILSVSELLTHTITKAQFPTFQMLSLGRGFRRKYCIAICTEGAACFTGRNSGLVNKIK